MFIRKDTCKQAWQVDTIQTTTTIFLVYTYICVYIYIYTYICIFNFPQLECKLHKRKDFVLLIIISTMSRTEPSTE